MSDEIIIRQLDKFYEVKKYFYYSYFYLASIIFLWIGFNMPYTMEYKLSNVLIWGLIILVIPDVLMKLGEVTKWLKEKLDERID